jgi:hypothetical protein
MLRAVREDVVAELGAEIDVSEMTADQQALLVAAIREARAQQRAVLEAAITAAMEHVPRLLRGALRKVLFG